MTDEREPTRLRDTIAEALAAPVEVDDRTLDRQAFPDLEDARAAYVATERNKRVAALRAGAAVQAFQAQKAADPETRPVAGRGAKAVAFGHVELIEGGVEVWLGTKSGKPDYRIFNPPTLVYDAQGDIEVRGRMHREDPLGALAEVIAGAGQQTQKRSHR